MIKTNQQRLYNTIMADLFKNAFVSALKSLPEKHRKELMQNSRMFFNKWFYSSLVDGSLLSPANLLLAAHDSNENASMRYLNFYVNTKKEPVFYYTDYSIESHPFIEDLRFFSNTFDGYERRDFLNDEYYKSAEFFQGFSMPDADYARFLRTAAVRMGVLDVMPSINADVLKKGAGFDKILAMDNMSILRAAVEAIVCDCADRLNKIVNSDDAVYDKLHLFLKKPVCVVDEIQDIFGGFCENVIDGLDIASLADHPDEFIHGLIESGAKSVRYEITLDKYFFTPLSCYLKLVQPVYIERMRMMPLFSEFSRRLDMNEPSATDNLLYYLCWGYSFTPLGMDVLENAEQVAQASLEGDEVLLPTDVSPAPIFDAINRAFYPEFRDSAVPFNIKSAISTKLLTDVIESKNATVFGLSITCEKIMKETLYVEIGGSSPMDTLHEHVCAFIGVDPNLDYTITIGATANPFNTYSYEAEVEFLNTAYINFDSLPIDASTVMYYTIYGIGVVKDGQFPEDELGITFEISSAKQMGARYGRVYPWQKLMGD